MRATSAGSVAELVKRLGAWLCALVGTAAALAVFAVRPVRRPSTNGAVAVTVTLHFVHSSMSLSELSGRATFDLLGLAAVAYAIYRIVCHLVDRSNEKRAQVAQAATRHRQLNRIRRTRSAGARSSRSAAFVVNGPTSRSSLIVGQPTIVSRNTDVILMP